MAVKQNLLRRVQKGVTNHVLDFAKQTVLGGPKYFLNRGTIEGHHKDPKTGQARQMKIYRFDRLVGLFCVKNCFDF